MDGVTVLIPSPLNGPLVWAPVSRVLRGRGVETIITPVLDGEGTDGPYWVRHAASVAQELDRLPSDRSVVLVAHSGAGMLLPAIGAFSPCPVAAYVFVDAGLPFGSSTRMREIELSAPELARELRERLAAGGRFPEWTDEEAREVIPDDGLRRAVLAELRPRSEDFFSEEIPVFGGWPDAPCGYLKLSSAYDRHSEQAQGLGWPVREIEAGHFHMLVDPERVAAALIELVSTLPRSRARPDKRA